jgi:hypothetical protein
MTESKTGDMLNVQHQTTGLSADTANEIYDILIATCRAQESNRDQFVRYLGEKHDHYEFRFCGALGFGGKLYLDRFSGLRVDCYREDRTPERESMIADANSALKVTK